jgi:hypothetical protein
MRPTNITDPHDPDDESESSRRSVEPTLPIYDADEPGTIGHDDDLDDPLADDDLDDDDDDDDDDALDDDDDEIDDDDTDDQELRDEMLPGLIEVEPRTVLITGACGNIGRKLRAAWADVYDLVLIDRTAPEDDTEVIVADLAIFDEEWITHFHGVDTVVHLAANPNEFAPWDELIGPNLNALSNVFNAAALAGVE